MAKQRKFKNVEWLDEHLIGHSTAYRLGDNVFVEVGLYGSVVLDGKEYILDQTLQVTVEPCNIPIPPRDDIDIDVIH